MSKVKLKYVGLVDPAELVLPGQDGWSETGNTRRIINRGDVIDVDEETAGLADHWRPVEDGEIVHPSRETRDNGDVREVHDLGSGLLSQLGNWQRVGGTTKATAKNDEKGA